MTPLERRHPRDHLLAVALDLAASERSQARGWATAARLVSLTRVAQALGVTRTAVYRMWSSQEDFWADLVAHEAQLDDALVLVLVSGRPPRGLDGDVDAGLVWIERRLAWLQAQIGALTSSPVLTAVLGYRLSADLARAQARVVELAVRLIEAWLEEWLAAVRRTPRPGVRLRTVAELVYALVDGARSHAALVGAAPDPDDDAPSGRPSTLAPAVAGVLIALTVEGPLQERGRYRQAPEVAPETRPDRRQRALDVASLLLRAAGNDPDAAISAFGWVTIERVARIAHVSRPTVYQYWSSDDEMRLSMFRTLADRFADRAVATAADPLFRSPRSVAQATAVAHLLLDGPHSLEARFLLFAFAMHSGREEIAATTRRLFDRILGLIAGAIGTPLASSSDLAASAALLGWLGCRRFASIAEATEDGTGAERTVQHYALLWSLLPHLGTEIEDPSVLALGRT